MDEHPLVLFYVVGCFLVVILTLLKVASFRAINWVIKANILNKNLRKLLPPNDKACIDEASSSLGLLLIETALSWINVPVIMWQIIAELFRVTRDLLTPAPEEIKLLRFPLRNNPDMSREAVWAYVYALRMKSGEMLPNESALVASLEELSSLYPSFDPEAALKQLAGLNVLDSNVIAASLNRLQSSADRIV